MLGYRLRLSPEHAADRIYRHRDRRVRGEEARPQGGSREFLSKPAGTQCTGRDGSDRARALVRAPAGGVAARVVDRRPGRDSSQASTEAEERSSGRRTSVAVDGGEPLSPDLGAQSGEPGSTATALASASSGTDANPRQEPTPGPGLERGSTAQEGVMEQAGAGTVRVTRAGSLGWTPAAGFAGDAGSTDPEDRRTQSSDSSRKPKTGRRRNG